MDDESRELLDRVRAVVEERDALRARLEEREADMHARIRAGYDRTVADSWRAKVAQVEAERDVLRADAERLRTLLREAAEEVEHYSRERAALVAAAKAWDKAASAYYASEGTPSEWDAMQAAKRAFREAQRGA